jgi:hypothetical protein
MEDELPFISIVWLDRKTKDKRKKGLIFELFLSLYRRLYLILSSSFLSVVLLLDKASKVIYQHVKFMGEEWRNRLRKIS